MDDRNARQISSNHLFIRFRVVHSSSEDPVYPSSELNTHIPTTKGWQSLKFCPFPQELGFQLIDGDCKLSQVQILSHQFKIATKIEIYIGQGHDYHSATFRRLGYLSLDSNERSSYQARELKTVYIDQSGRFIKLLVHNNHVNKQNMYCQVGIVAVNLLGVDDDYSGRQSAMQTHGDPRNAPAKSAVNNPLLDLSVDLNLDPATSDKLRQLSAAKVLQRVLFHFQFISTSQNITTCNLQTANLLDISIFLSKRQKLLQQKTMRQRRK